MTDIKKIYFTVSSAPFLIIILVIAIILMVCESSSADSSITPVSSYSDFKAPFSDNSAYQISSPFGDRVDPATQKILFHNGIDLKAKEGTEIVASASGKVWKTGYETGGLGNYVKLEHDVNGVKYYTAYGHMKDNSIVVHDGEMVAQGQKLGVIGMSGYATGIHVHFMIMTPNCTYNKADVKDPTSIITADQEQRKSN